MVRSILPCEEEEQEGDNSSLGKYDSCANACLLLVLIRGGGVKLSKPKA